MGGPTDLLAGGPKVPTVGGWWTLLSVASSFGGRALRKQTLAMHHADVHAFGQLNIAISSFQEVRAPHNVAGHPSLTII